MTSSAKTVKCELRSLISLEQYGTLTAFFSNVGTLNGEDHQETRYFEGEHDLRIQKNATCAKVWLKKKGLSRDDKRDEIELRIEPERFGELERLFDALDYKTAVTWLRHRLSYEWDGVTVALDHIKGYGYVAEFIQMCEPDLRIGTLDVLREKMALLGLAPTPKPVLHERFSYYRDHWQKLITEEMKMPG